jgi:hypothetical protein
MPAIPRSAYNESLITFVEPLSTVEQGAVVSVLVMLMFTTYNAVKLRTATNALNNASIWMKRSVALYIYAAMFTSVPAVFAILQVWTPSFVPHTILELDYCVSLWVSTWRVGTDYLSLQV